MCENVERINANAEGGRRNAELKPVRCGCGGEAVKVQHELFSCVFGWDIHCMKCGIETQMFDTEAEAISAWNKAMTGNETGIRPPRLAEWAAQPLTK